MSVFSLYNVSLNRRYGVNIYSLITTYVIIVESAYVFKISVYKKLY